MKIIQLTAENIKKVSAIDITPDGNLVQITGRNAQGKSTVLDCIWYALSGAKDLPSHPIKDGAESGEITLDMGEYVVIRRFTPKGTTLTVKSAKGATFPSPQKLLDKMLGDMAFDPLEFSRMKPTEQFERLRVISGVGDKLEEIEGLEKTAFEDRTIVNRDAKALDSQIEGIVVPVGTPAEPIDISAVVAEGEKKRDENATIQGAIQSITNFKDKVTLNRLKIQEAQDFISSLEKDNKLQLDSIAAIQKTADTPLHDLTDLRTKVQEANDTNRAVAEKQRREKLKNDFTATTTKAEILTATIDGHRAAKKALMEGANMPVEGLTLDAGQIYFNGIPFAQASTAEQLKVSVAIAMAAKPEIRVIRIKDGSLLDDENMKVLREMAEQNDYQVWVERVDGSGEVGIVMEDGQVKTVNQ